MRNRQHAILDPFQEKVKELLLSLTSFRTVIDLPLAATMGIEPLVLRCQVPEAFKGTTGMQSLIGPACAHKRGQANGRKMRALACPILIVQRMGTSLLQKILCWWILRIMIGDDPALIEQWQKARFRNPAVVSEFTIHVGDAFPGNDRLEVRRIEGSYRPLGHSQVREIGRAHV